MKFSWYYIYFYCKIHFEKAQNWWFVALKLIWHINNAALTVNDNVVIINIQLLRSIRRSLYWFTMPSVIYFCNVSSRLWFFLYITTCWENPNQILKILMEETLKCRFYFDCIVKFRFYFDCIVTFRFFFDYNLCSSVISYWNYVQIMWSKPEECVFLWHYM